MKVNYSFSSIVPTRVQSIGTFQKPLYQVIFDTEEVHPLENDEESTSGQSLIKQYKSLYVQVAKLDYATLVSAIIMSRYSSSDIEALVLNNMEALSADSGLTDEKAAEYIEEFNALQQWRQHAKAIAKSVMEGAQ